MRMPHAHILFCHYSKNLNFKATLIKVYLSWKNIFHGNFGTFIFNCVLMSGMTGSWVCMTKECKRTARISWHSAEMYQIHMKKKEFSNIMLQKTDRKKKFFVDRPLYECEQWVGCSFEDIFVLIHSSIHWVKHSVI